MENPKDKIVKDLLKESIRIALKTFKGDKEQIDFFIYYGIYWKRYKNGIKWRIIHI